MHFTSPIYCWPASIFQLCDVRSPSPVCSLPERSTLKSKTSSSFRFSIHFRSSGMMKSVTHRTPKIHSVINLFASIVAPCCSSELTYRLTRLWIRLGSRLLNYLWTYLEEVKLEFKLEMKRHIININLMALGWIPIKSGRKGNSLQSRLKCL